MHSHQAMAKNDVEIIIPYLYIKPPGSSFLDEKTSSIHIDSGEPTFHLQYLLEDFKMKTNSYPCSPKKQYSEKLDTPSFSASSSKKSLKSIIGQYNSSSSNPGKIKKSSEDLADILRLAHKILAAYQINLVIDSTCRSGRLLFDLIRDVTLEVCLYPTEFFSKLQIKELIFIDENSSRRPTSRENAYFSLGHSTTHKMIMNQLYQLIFDRIFSNNISILTEWNQLKRSQDESSREFMRETFLLLIKNKKTTLSQKQNVEDLKKLLSKYYPEISKEWLIYHAQEKKKIAKVRFC